MNEAVAGYRGAVESLAARMSRSRRANRVGAEYDDLVQEGLIFVWQSLERRICPSADMIENRMRSYVRWMGRSSVIPYEAMLPLDDFRVVMEA